MRHKSTCIKVWIFFFSCLVVRSFCFSSEEPVQLLGSRLFRRLGGVGGVSESPNINLTGHCALPLPPCCFGIYVHCLHRAHMEGRRGGLQSIPLSLLTLLPPSQPDSQALMMKIKEHHTLWLLICCASVLCVVLHDSWFSEFTFPRLRLHLYGLPSTLPCVQPHFTSPTSIRPLPVPGQVSAYKFENDLSCPLNNRWESRVRVPSINSVRALISEQKKKKRKNRVCWGLWLWLCVGN